MLAWFDSIWHVDHFDILFTNFWLNIYRIYEFPKLGIIYASLGFPK